MNPVNPEVTLSSLPTFGTALLGRPVGLYVVVVSVARSTFGATWLVSYERERGNRVKNAAAVQVFGQS